MQDAACVQMGCGAGNGQRNAQGRRQVEAQGLRIDIARTGFKARWPCEIPEHSIDRRHDQAFAAVRMVNDAALDPDQAGVRTSRYTRNHFAVRQPVAGHRALEQLDGHGHRHGQRRRRQ